MNRSSPWLNAAFCFALLGCGGDGRPGVDAADASGPDSVNGATDVSPPDATQSGSIEDAIVGADAALGCPKPRKFKGCERFGEDAWYCADGEIIRISGGDSGYCMTVETIVYQCLSGCRAETEGCRTNKASEVDALCADNGASVGAACDSDADCAVPNAPRGSDGLPRNQYLVCKEGLCAEGPPIPDDGIGAICGSGDIQRGFDYVVKLNWLVPATVCTHGLCWEKGYSSGCRIGQCVRRCEGDHECPPGTACEFGPEGDIRRYCVDPTVSDCGID